MVPVPVGAREPPEPIKRAVVFVPAVTALNAAELQTTPASTTLPFASTLTQSPEVKVPVVEAIFDPLLPPDNALVAIAL